MELFSTEACLTSHSLHNDAPTTEYSLYHAVSMEKNGHPLTKNGMRIIHSLTCHFVNFAFCGPYFDVILAPNKKNYTDVDFIFGKHNKKYPSMLISINVDAFVQKFQSSKNPHL